MCFPCFCIFIVGGLFWVWFANIILNNLTSSMYLCYQHKIDDGLSLFWDTLFNKFLVEWYTSTKLPLAESTFYDLPSKQKIVCYLTFWSLYSLITIWNVVEQFVSECRYCTGWITLSSTIVLWYLKRHILFSNCCKILTVKPTYITDLYWLFEFKPSPPKQNNWQQCDCRRTNNKPWDSSISASRYIVTISL